MFSFSIAGIRDTMMVMGAMTAHEHIHSRVGTGSRALWTKTLPQCHGVDPHAAGHVELAYGSDFDRSRLLKGEDGGLQVRQEGAESPNL